MMRSTSGMRERMQAALHATDEALQGIGSGLPHPSATSGSNSAAHAMPQKNSPSGSSVLLMRLSQCLNDVIRIAAPQWKKVLMTSDATPAIRKPSIHLR